MCQIVEMIRNGEFLNKDPDEAFNYFGLLAENAQSWISLIPQIGLDHLPTLLGW